MRLGERWQRRAYGWRKEESIGAATSFGRRPDLTVQRSLRDIGQTAYRRHARSMRSRWVAVLSVMPILFAVIVGAVAGAPAGIITFGASVVPLVLLARVIDVRQPG